MHAVPDFSQVPPKYFPLCAGLAEAAQGNVLMTLEALLPQFRAMCRAFYRTHPATAHPIAAYRWLYRELYARFGHAAVLTRSRAINARLRRAHHGVRIALEVS